MGSIHRGEGARWMLPIIMSGGQMATWVQVDIDLPPGTRRSKLGVAAKRTARQRFLIRHGYHPLSPTVKGRTLPLARGADRRGVLPLKVNQWGPRCGTCRHLTRLIDDTPKCGYDNGRRVTNGNATTVRLWWPGCRDYAAVPGEASQ